MDSSLSNKVSRLPHLDRFQRRLRSQMGEILEELDSLGEKSSREQIHRLRVLSRRSRASLAVLEKLYPEQGMAVSLKPLRALTRILGPVRSLDVSEKDLGRQWKALDPGLAKNLRFLRKELDLKRKRARKEMAQKIKAKKIVKKLKRQPLPERVGHVHPGEFFQLLEQLEAKASARLKGNWKKFHAGARISKLHTVRIALKKWRYLLEIQAECVDFPKQPFFDRVKTLQDRLGRIHDLEVLRDCLAKNKFKKQAKAHKAQREYRSLLKRLDEEIVQGVDSFHREGARLLLPLLERSAA